jgi:hypothetical protein
MQEDYGITCGILLLGVYSLSWQECSYGAGGASAAATNGFPAKRRRGSRTCARSAKTRTGTSPAKTKQKRPKRSTSSFRLVQCAHTEGRGTRTPMLVDQHRFGKPARIPIPPSPRSGPGRVGPSLAVGADVPGFLSSPYQIAILLPCLDKAIAALSVPRIPCPWATGSSSFLFWNHA